MAATDSIQPASRHPSALIKHSGCLHKGQQKVAASASIPSKYQTIVLSNNEKKGFHSCSKRFVSHEYDDSPGPAKYNTAQTLLKENASFSKKGLGGFVSKVKRFPTALNEDFSVGPGQYTPIRKIDHDFNKAKCTSNFHKPIAEQNDFGKFQTPAPNQYNLSSKHPGRATNKGVSASAAFMSRTRRDLVTAKLSNSVPAPGTYEIGDKLSSSRATQAPFRSTTMRNLLSNNVLENPGPGTYDPYEPILHQPEKRGLPRKHYLCISAPAAPMPPQPLLPGPGQYNLVNYHGPPKEYVSSSMFVSTTNRWNGDSLKAGPGPGTYNPRHYAKRSFIYNSDQKWI